MVPKRFTAGIIVAGCILVCYSLFFNSVMAMVCAAALVVTILWRLFLFQKKISSVVSGIECRRSVSNTLVRQGTLIEVSLTTRVTFPPDVSGVIRDQVPIGMFLRGTEPEIRIPPGSSSLSETVLQYQVAPVIHGSFLFPGLLISLEDLFFSDHLEVRTKMFSGPTVRVYPLENFESPVITREYGEQEIERIRVVSGFGIRGFRDYVPGDDPKKIDWKLSAKFDKLIIREYEGSGGTVSLIFADLPEQGDTEPGEDFQNMVKAITGAVEISIREYHTVSLILISGPNVITTQKHANDLQEVMHILHNNMVPVKRVHSYYRFSTVGAFRSFIGEISRQGSVGPQQTAHHDYCNRLAAITSTIAKKPEILSFQGEISRILRMAAQKDALVFSLCTGDVSHISFLIEEIHKEHGKVHLQMPSVKGSPSFARHYLQTGADSVKVFS
jgi:uncharacterized protein (DUF58 family)